MIRDQLRQLRKIKYRIQALRERIAEMDARLTNGVQRLTQEGRGNAIPDWAETEIRVLEMKADLYAQIDELMRLEKRITDMVEGLNEFPERQLFTCRYIYGWSWNKIAYIMNYSKERIYQIHRQTLKQLEGGQDNADDSEKKVH